MSRHCPCKRDGRQPRRRRGMHEGGEWALLVLAHEPGVPNHIGRQDSGKPLTMCALRDMSPGHPILSKERWGALAHIEPNVSSGSKATVCGPPRYDRNWGINGLRRCESGRRRRHVRCRGHSRRSRRGTDSTRLPSRPGEFHPEPLTDPDVILSHHPAHAITRRLPPSAKQ